MNASMTHYSHAYKAWTSLAFLNLKTQTASLRRERARDYVKAFLKAYK